MLGVGPAASTGEVSRAYRVLAEKMAQSAAPDELLLLLARARDASLHFAPLAPPDPRRLLGVGPTSTAAEVHKAWRRIAALTHPDQGGTDELFRAVAEARDRLTGRWAPPGGRSHRRRPPPKPPPPGPFRAPPAHLRIRPRRRTAAADLALHASVTVAVGSLAVLPIALFGLRAVLLSLLLLPTVIWLSRPSFQNASWAAVRLRSGRARTPEEGDPERFLAESALDVPVGRETHARLYSAYLGWCAAKGAAALSQWEFVEELRSYGLLFVRISGTEESIWVGVRLRDAHR